MFKFDVFYMFRTRGFIFRKVVVYTVMVGLYQITRTQYSTHSVPTIMLIPYTTAFPYGNGMVLHFYQQQESSTTKTVHKVINKGLKTYV